MKAVVVGDDRLPLLTDVEMPKAEGGLSLVTMRAAALTNLDVMICQGRHYLSSPTLPAWVGREGIAQTTGGGRVYLNVNAILPRYGSMAEQTIADLGHALPVPDGVGDALAAALGNPGLAAWLPLSWRAKLQPSERVLILGATGTSGLIAVAAAAAMKAETIVAVGRSATGLQRASSLGATDIVTIGDGDLLNDLREVSGRGFDVVLDYLNGPPAEAAIQTMAVGGRMVQIGAGLAPGIHLPAQIARKQSLDVLGFAYYHVPIEAQRAAYRSVCELAAKGEIRIDFETHSLDDFRSAWDRQLSGVRRRQVVCMASAQEGH